MIDYHSTLALRPLNAMEVVAWSSMSDEEFIERLSKEAWKTPNGPGYSGVGVTRSRVAILVRFYAEGRNGKKRRKMIERIRERARVYFAEACDDFTTEVLCHCNQNLRQWPISKIKLKQLLPELVPYGAHDEVTERIGKLLNWE